MDEADPGMQRQMGLLGKMGADRAKGVIFNRSQVTGDG